MARKKSGKRKSNTQKRKVQEQVRQRNSFARYIPVAVLGLVLIFAVILLLRNGDPGRENDLAGGEVDYTDKPKPVVTIEMENDALIKVELDPVNAPNTVKNFIALAEAGFYDGLTFHRVMPDFMIQGGCPEGTGGGGPGYAIRGEFAENGHANELLHERGVISMARSKAPDSAGSQFFITVADKPHLDGEYAAFGTVLEGMDEVDRIVSVPTDALDKPLEEQRIRQVSVELFGVEYGLPEKI